MKVRTLVVRATQLAQMILKVRTWVVRATPLAQGDLDSAYVGGAPRDSTSTFLMIPVSRIVRALAVLRDSASTNLKRKVDLKVGLVHWLA